MSLGPDQREPAIGVRDEPLLPQVQVDAGIVPRFEAAIPMQQVRLLEEGLRISGIRTPACMNDKPQSLEEEFFRQTCRSFDWGSGALCEMVQM